LQTLRFAVGNRRARNWKTGFLLLYGYIYHAAFQQKRIGKALFLCGKKRVRLRQKRMEEAGIFYVELLW
jgi:hypothetical protein